MRTGHRSDLEGMGLSQEEIARRLGVSRAYVSQVERRAIAKLRRIALGSGRELFPLVAERLRER